MVRLLTLKMTTNIHSSQQLPDICEENISSHLVQEGGTVNASHYPIQPITSTLPYPTVYQLKRLQNLNVMSATAIILECFQSLAQHSSLFSVG
jgi:hypothetical protein